MAQKLFDKASLVMIPSQYKEGKIYNIKPEDQSSSFEFERGSAATRVNSSGLIERSPTNGIELVTNGTFDEDASWNRGVGYTISNGSLIATNTANNSLTYQNKTYPIGVYKVTAEVTITSGAVRFQIGAAFISETFTTSGLKTVYIAITSQQTYFGINTSVANSNFSIDNVSVQEVNLDTPRLDYSGTEPALLLEPQRTNLIAYSNAFDSWNIVGSPIITSDYGISPEGLQNSTRFQAISDRVNYNVGAINADETFSVYMKGSGELRIQVGSDNFYTTVTSEWVRYEFKTTQVGAASNVQIRGNGSEVDLELYGAQYEQGSYATSYIPTNGQTETRLADVCTGGGDASVFNDSEGTLYLEYEPEKDLQMVSLSNGTSAEAVWFYLINGGTTLSVYVNSGGGQVASINSGTYESITANSSVVKVAATYKTNEFKSFVNGSLIATDTAGATPTGLNLLEFKYPTGSTYNTKAKIRALYYFPEVLTDTELQQLTSNT